MSRYRIVSRKLDAYNCITVYYAQTKIFKLFWVDCEFLDLWFFTFFPEKQNTNSVYVGLSKSDSLSSVEKYIEEKIKKRRYPDARNPKSQKIIKEY